MIKKANSLLCLLLAAAFLFSVCAFDFAVAYAKQSEEEKLEQRVDEILASMTLSEKAAQMLFVYLPSEEATKKQEKYQFGGYILFAKSFKNSTKSKMKKKLNGYQKASKINMLIGVDEEGGTVVRVSKYKQFRKTPYKSPRSVYISGGWKALESDAKSKSQFLNSLGINTNFAPVADVSYKKNDFIYKRTLSTNANGVSKFVRLTVNEMNKENEIGCLKHFPGYGNNGDTHSKLIVDKRSKKTFETRDLKPFAAGIKAGAPMIMVSHNIVNCFDKKNTASLSKKVHNYLREEMHFEGIIITDGLDMEGVKKKYGSNEEIAVKAVKAGNDMLCTPHGATSLNAIKKAVKSGEIKESRIDESVRRILRIKLKYGIVS